MFLGQCQPLHVCISAFWVRLDLVGAGSWPSRLENCPKSSNKSKLGPLSWRNVSLCELQHFQSLTWSSPAPPLHPAKPRVYGRVVGFSSSFSLLFEVIWLQGGQHRQGQQTPNSGGALRLLLWPVTTAHPHPELMDPSFPSKNSLRCSLRALGSLSYRKKYF